MTAATAAKIQAKTDAISEITTVRLGINAVKLCSRENALLGSGRVAENAGTIVFRENSIRSKIKDTKTFKISASNTAKRGSHRSKARKKVDRSPVWTIVFTISAKNRRRNLL